jgi:CDP-2,3-bis-(O-geranylgeranyl)-sn-glycerol synthase
MLTMLGDCVSSFIKRRLGYSQSSHARGLDTVLESLLPTLFLKQQLGLGLTDILLLVLVFFLLEEFVRPFFINGTFVTGLIRPKQTSIYD